jgi:hypothetical protein
MRAVLAALPIAATWCSGTSDGRDVLRLAD